MKFRNQQAHTILNKYIELAKRSQDYENIEDMVHVRKYLNHIEARIVGLEQRNKNLNEKLEKRLESLC